MDSDKGLHIALILAAKPYFCAILSQLHEPLWTFLKN
jgi:hypothetical protein